LFGADDDPKGNFYNLMKSVGSSAKSGNQGGSYGLGKASFLPHPRFVLFSFQAYMTMINTYLWENLD
jgi:hypothetical protein